MPTNRLFNLLLVFACTVVVAACGVEKKKQEEETELAPKAQKPSEVVEEKGEQSGNSEFDPEASYWWGYVGKCLSGMREDKGELIPTIRCSSMINSYGKNELLERLQGWSRSNCPTKVTISNAKDFSGCHIEAIAPRLIHSAVEFQKKEENCKADPETAYGIVHCPDDE